MSTIRALRARPWLAAAVAGALAAVAFLVVPVSYQRTTGYDVAVRLSGSNLGLDRVREIAEQLKGLLRVEHVAVRATDVMGRPEYVFDASVPAASGPHAGAAAQAFAAGLTKLGYGASATATPRKERVWGSVYAYARDRVIEISVDGKSAAQLESEIRQRLLEAGVTNAQVSVTDAGGDKRKIEMRVEAQHHEPPAANQPAQEMPELVLKKAGVPIGSSNGFTVRVEKRKAESGTTLIVNVGQNGKTAEAQVPNSESMTDAALGAEIESQLKRAGVDVIVKATNGHLEIQPRQEH